MSALFFILTIKEVIAVAGLYFMCDLPRKLKTQKTSCFCKELAFEFLVSH
jgi:hypothetical protein